MIIYALIFLLPAMMSIANIQLDSQLSKFSFYLFCFFLIIFVGLRFENGVDWWNYLIFQRAYEDMSFAEVFSEQDPGYGLLNWLSYKLFDGSIFFVNFLSAFFFIAGLAIFCKEMPSPWLAMAISVSFLVIVMGMNYTRQSAALGFALIALTSLFKQRKVMFFLYIALAISFHKSAIVLLPLALFGLNNRLIVFVAMIFFAPLFYYAFISSFVEAQINLYLGGGGMDSSGAYVRVSLSFTASIFYLLFRKELNLPINIRTTFDVIAGMNSFLFLMLFIFPSTTVIDRFALFFTPMQIFIFSTLPYIFRPFPLSALIILMVYGAQLFIWLSYSYYAPLWIPYNFWIF
ncbi:MAG TPA: hypothetical protein DHV86_05855 [Methylophilaceae bacterium]|nr:hypothetical protein [Methylophilaceae bacterium]